jgi:uncharacterized protein
MPLRILALSDIHGKRAGFEYAIKMVKDLVPDVVVISGDVCSGYDVATVFTVLSGFVIPVLYVPGNMDPEDFSKGAGTGRANCHNINGRRKEVSGVGFVGIGAQMSGFLGSVRDLSDLLTAGDVLVSHFPPYGFNDTTHDGGHIGASDLLQLTKASKPRLVISGHVHESPGVMTSGQTVYVNPGPAYQERCAIIVIPEGGAIEARSISG